LVETVQEGLSSSDTAQALFFAGADSSTGRTIPQQSESPRQDFQQRVDADESSRRSSSIDHRKKKILLLRQN
jgi:hypothetical protein